MNNESAKVAAALRTLTVYGACALVAIIIGVLLTKPMSYTSLGAIGVICAVLLIPIFLKWHRPLMLLSWFTPITLFFVKGDPNLFLLMIALSLTATIAERAMGQKRFFSVPQITWPLLVLIVVVVITAKLTGGLGLRAFGSQTYGGKKYIFLVVAALGYFAIASSPIPPEKARKYVALYFSGLLLCAVEDFYSIVPHFLDPIFWLIPTDPSSFWSFNLGATRLEGIGAAAAGMTNIMLAYYGLRGIFLSGKPWRAVVYCLSFILIFLGGFRTAVIDATSVFLILFFLEGLHRTTLVLFLTVFTLAIGGALIPLGSKLPYTFQRALCFLPPSVIHLSVAARTDAQTSWDWRLRMWEALLPEIPRHLWLGKGYAISREDFENEMGANAAIRNTADASQEGLALSSDYHSGPLSVILPFGIWGVIGFVWFLWGSLWLMYRNYRYSMPTLQGINAFLLASYLTVVFIFIFGAGSLATNTNAFTGLLGLSVAINRGVRRKPREATTNVPFAMPLRRRPLRAEPASAPRFLPTNGRPN